MKKWNITTQRIEAQNEKEKLFQAREEEWAQERENQIQKIHQKKKNLDNIRSDIENLKKQNEDILQQIHENSENLEKEKQNFKCVFFIY